MITVSMIYEVIEGKQKEFETVFAEMLELMETMTGHRESHLYREVNRPNSYLIISEWTDREAFEDFTRSERFRDVVGGSKKQMLNSRPRHEIFERSNLPPQLGPHG